MLSKIIRAQIEAHFGKEIRYPTDCEALAGHISLQCKQRVSTSTLKRLLGFVKGTKEPRLYTLDVIAQYLGHANWDKYIETINHIENSAFVSIEQVETATLHVGNKINLGYEPGRKLSLKYVGDYYFDVQESINSKLQKGDRIKVHHFVLDFPLLVTEVIRNHSNMGQFTAGKLSGLTSIEIVK